MRIFNGAILGFEHSTQDLTTSTQIVSRYIHRILSQKAGVCIVAIRNEEKLITKIHFKWNPTPPNSMIGVSFHLTADCPSRKSAWPIRPTKAIADNTAHFVAFTIGENEKRKLLVPESQTCISAFEELFLSHWCNVTEKNLIVWTPYWNYETSFL